MQDASTEPSPRASSAELFDGLSDTWSAMYAAEHASQSYEFRTRQDRAGEMLMTRLHKGSRVLEIGCGAGLNAMRLVGNGFEVSAFDVSEAMVAETSRLARRTGSTVRLHHGDVGSLPPDWTAFDGAVALGVTEYVGDLSELLTAVRSRLASGGTCVISFTNSSSPFRWIELPIKRALAALLYVIRRDARSRQIAFAAGGAHTEPAVSRALRAAGFAPQQVSYFGYGLRFEGRWLPAAAHQAAIGRSAARSPILERTGRMFLVAADAVDLDAPTTIRPGTLADLEHLIDAHRAAFAGTMGVSLGPVYLRALLAEYLTSDDAFALLAHADGHLVGYILGNPVTKPSVRANRRLIGAAAVGALTHPRVMLDRRIRDEARRRVGLLRTPRREEATEDSHDRLEPPVVSLVGIGTLDAVRGRGIGRRLVQAFEAEAIRRGYRSARLSVYQANATARALYASEGWQPFPHPTNESVLYYGKPL